mmetsp:Transcript_41298/g.99489  ORF Transcript_41298/g.99489 Transcript_41298/m.99489 type:complete len:487 (-) Transcript_41298:323-1783(-)
MTRHRKPTQDYSDDEDAHEQESMNSNFGASHGAGAAALPQVALHSSLANVNGAPVDNRLHKRRRDSMERLLVLQQKCTLKVARDAMRRSKRAMGYPTQFPWSSLAPDTLDHIFVAASAHLDYEKKQGAGINTAASIHVPAVEQHLQQDDYSQDQDNSLVVAPDGSSLSQSLHGIPPILQNRHIDHTKWTLIYNLVWKMIHTVQQARQTEQQFLSHLPQTTDSTRQGRTMELLAAHQQLNSNCQLLATNALAAANAMLISNGIYCQVATEETSWFPHLQLQAMRPIGLTFHAMMVNGDDVQSGRAPQRAREPSSNQPEANNQNSPQRRKKRRWGSATVGDRNSKKGSRKGNSNATVSQGGSRRNSKKKSRQDAFQDVAAAAQGLGRGRERTLPAWMTNGTGPDLPPRNEAPEDATNHPPPAAAATSDGMTHAGGIPPGLSPLNNNNAPVAMPGRGRGRGRTLPAWMTARQQVGNSGGAMDPIEIEES